MQVLGYPNELYFQTRNVDGFEDGIYHIEVGTSSAVILQNLKIMRELKRF